MNLMQPYVTDAMRAAVADVLLTRWIGQGPRVDEFEQRFSARFSGRSMVATGSGTDALHLAYQLAGIGPDSTVIAPVFTCTATNIPLLYLGARIVFADVAPGSLNIDPDAVDSLIEAEGADAVAVVHYGGAPATMRSGWPIVIEDCAQALGATGVGVDYDYACYSFQAVKQITTGDGGMLACPNEEIAERARRIRWFGIDRQAKLDGTWANDITEVGFKYQMTDIAAAMGLAGLDAFDAQLAHRRTLRDIYALGLAGSGVELLDTDPGSACWLSTVLCDDRAGLRAALAASGIESDQVHYRNDRYSIFERYRRDCPNMDAIEGRYLCLPMHMGLSIEDVEQVCAVVRAGW